MIIHYLIKLIFIIFIFSTYLESKEVSKAIFTINNQIYTNIDIENRKRYLSLIEQDISNENLVLNDYISVILFNEFAIKRKIKVNQTIINDYLTAIKNKENSDLLKEEIIRTNIIYDYQRKVILEKFIKEDIENKKNDKDFNQSDLFDINIKYFVIDLIYKKNLEEMINIKNIDKNNIDKIKLIMNQNEIKYNYYEKQVINLNNINKNIKDDIINNKDNFYFIENYIIFGIIYKQLKDNLNFKYTLYQIKNLTNKKLDNKKINCSMIDELNNNKNINVVKYDKIEGNKINENIKKELNLVNDKILIKNNQKEEIYIILCELDYDIELLEERLFIDKIDSLAKKFENEFILDKKKEYDFTKYE